MILLKIVYQLIFHQVSHLIKMEVESVSRQLKRSGEELISESKRSKIMESSGCPIRIPINEVPTKQVSGHSYLHPNNYDCFGSRGCNYF
jgi:hypothetical protein